MSVIFSHGAMGSGSTIVSTIIAIVVRYRAGQ
jgi:hypothetical protein